MLPQHREKPPKDILDMHSEPQTSSSSRSMLGTPPWLWLNVGSGFVCVCVKTDLSSSRTQIYQNSFCPRFTNTQQLPASPVQSSQDSRELQSVPGVSLPRASDAAPAPALTSSAYFLHSAASFSSDVLRVFRVCISKVISLPGTRRGVGMMLDKEFWQGHRAFPGLPHGGRTAGAAGLWRGESSLGWLEPSRRETQGIQNALGASLAPTEEQDVPKYIQGSDFPEDN